MTSICWCHNVVKSVVDSSFIFIRTPFRSALPRWSSVTYVLWVFCLAPAPALGQVANYTTPEAAGASFLRGVRAIRWEAVADAMDVSALDRFRTTVTMISDSDASGALRERLVTTDSTGLGALSHGDVFSRAISTLIDGMPGLMHALYDRDDEVLGHVAESGGADLTDGTEVAHVVYRTTARISGAVPEVRVMQLRRNASGWRVAWSEELEVLEAALRGFGR